MSISQPVSIAEVRAANYLASAIGKNMGSAPGLRSDVDTRANLDLDFIALGGPFSNFKTQDCLENSSNHLAIIDRATGLFVRRKLIRKEQDRELIKREADFDYGMILKIHPSQFPSRTWIACIGIGECGTSGAAWFLANKWGEIKDKAGARPFAVIVRVRPGQDESAELTEYLVVW